MFDVGEGWSTHEARPARGVIARANDASEQCYILLSGLVVQEKLFAEKHRQIVGLHVPGDVCNLSVLADQAVRHNLLAVTPVTYRSINRLSLSTLARERPGVSLAIWREMSREADIATMWTANIGQRRAYARIAHLICELEARWRAAGRDTSRGFDRLGTQADIGAATGLSLVHVNKTLGKLEEDRLISCRQKLVVLDLPRLEQIAGFDPAYLGLDRQSLGSMLLARLDGRTNECWPAHSGVSAESRTDRLSSAVL